MAQERWSDDAIWREAEVASEKRRELRWFRCVSTSKPDPPPLFVHEETLVWVGVHSCPPIDELSSAYTASIYRLLGVYPLD
jgi:hypothetical protein